MTSAIWSQKWPRLLALLASAVLLATLSNITPVAAATDCTYRFPASGGLYAETVVDGDVICGGPGPDRVVRMEGGRFRAGRGGDRVRQLFGGTYIAGPGPDKVGEQWGGAYRGGRGGDWVLQAMWRNGSLFEGGRGPDRVWNLTRGIYRGGPGNDILFGLDPGEGTSDTAIFDGGDGEDSIEECMDSPPGIHINVEHLPDHACG